MEKNRMDYSIPFFSSFLHHEAILYPALDPKNLELSIPKPK